MRKIHPKHRNTRNQGCLVPALILFFMFVAIICQAQCPVKGDSKSTKLQHLDSLKNRTETGVIDSTVTLAKILAPGNDSKRFSDSTYVSITGYVTLVKWGGLETCECHDKNQSQYDIHIQISDSVAGKRDMIVEINRFIRARSGTDIAALRKLKGWKIQITGWLFYDAEHWQNAFNTNPSGTDLWRTTCWEVHTVISIIPLYKWQGQ